MPLNDRKTLTDEELIRKGSQSAQPKAEAPRSAKARAAATDVGMDVVARKIKDVYATQIELDPKDRVVDAIELLTINYPGMTFPMNILFRMVNGGQKLLRQDSEEMTQFSKKVGRYRKYMITKYNRSFIICAGTIRGYVTREEHVEYVLPRAASRLASAINNATLVNQTVGNAETLKLSSERRGNVSSFQKAVEQMRRSVPLLTQGSKTNK